MVQVILHDEYGNKNDSLSAYIFGDITMYSNMRRHTCTYFGLGLLSLNIGGGDGGGGGFCGSCSFNSEW